MDLGITASRSLATTLVLSTTNLETWKKAKGYFHRALNIRLKNYRVNHLKLTTTYNHMGNVHKKLGDLKQAEHYHNYALSIRLKELRPEHVDVVISCGWPESR